MAAKAMKETAGILLESGDSKEVMAMVMAPNGSTKKGVITLRAGKVDGIYTDAGAATDRKVFETSEEE